MNLLKAISFKLVSALLFAVMAALVRYSGDRFPLGQIVFFRSAFAVLPVVLIYAYRRELRDAIYTRRPLGQLGRGLMSVFGMFSNFAALTRLPLADATAISFAAPLFTVVLAAIILKEKIRIFRWSAVIVGFGGVIVMLIPHLEMSHLTTAAVWGVVFALLSAMTNAGTTIQTRRLVQTETTPSIVFYFSLICALVSALTLPFEWVTPYGWDLAALVAAGVLGGFSHLFLTESYRHAPASVVAPFDYTAMIWAVLIGLWVFGEVPEQLVIVGALIVAGAGLFVIWRERQLGVKRARDAAAPRAPV